MDSEGKRRSPFLWLLMIPVQALLSAVMIWIGAKADAALFSKAGEGHGIPLFSVLFFMAAVVLFIAVIIVSVVLMAARLRDRRKSRRKS